MHMRKRFSVFVVNISIFLCTSRLEKGNSKSLYKYNEHDYNATTVSKIATARKRRRPAGGLNAEKAKDGAVNQ